MKMSQIFKDLAERAGFHVVRNYQNPAYTMMGLLGREYGTVLDVGANRGQFARKMQRHFSQATFHCFEPTPAAFESLSTWASTQRHVIPVQLALGESQGRLDMNFHADHGTSSSILETTEHCRQVYPFTAVQLKVNVQLDRLDDYVAALPAPLEEEVLLKLDVQGYEMQVIRGASRVLARTRACIIEVSLDELYQGQSRFADIVLSLTGQGLEYAGNLEQIYARDGHVIFLDALFVRPRAGEDAGRSTGKGRF